MDIAFVVLHYRTYTDTIACIKSIRSKIDTRDYHIIVVDNHSVNGSLEILQKEYTDAEDVTLIANNENLGFAKGLNTGIDYARSYFDPDYIALINNDTQLVSSGFIHVLNTKHKQYGFAVLGPMIITGEGMCNVNPILTKPRDAQNIQKAIDRYKRIYRICRAHLYGIYTTLIKLKPKNPKSKKILHLNDLTDCKLHGCFWILSREYFTIFNGLNPTTFLYGEEDILYLSVLSAGLHTLYTPDICIYHKENSSTDAAMPNSAEKAKFVCKHSVKSLKIYLEILADNDVLKEK